MIRQVRPDDFATVKTIKVSSELEPSKIDDVHYRLTVEKSGFLLPGYDETDFINDLHKIHLVYEEDGNILGFIRIDEEQEMPADADTTWFRPDLKDIYFAKPHADIGGIGVRSHVSKKGIASELLRGAIDFVREKVNVDYLFSFVIVSPVTNIPSLLFHEKNGFERIATVRFDEMFALKNFE